MEISKLMGRNRWFKAVVNTFIFLFLLYLFFLSIKLIGVTCKFIGKDVVKHFLANTSSPLVGLFVGILATSIVQSSSFTTSLVVGFVGSGVLPLEFAVPIIMGANIGTTVTNTIIAMGQIRWRTEFKRAISAAVVHDFFNILTVISLLPLELKFHYLSKTATALTGLFENVGGVKFAGPISMWVKPVAKFIKHLVVNVWGLPKFWAIVVLFAISIGMLLFALIYIVKFLRSQMISKIEFLIDRYIFRTGWIAMFLGFVVTAIVQSSSITTSLVVPLAGAGLISLEKAFPFTLGANVGTTMTALMASLVLAGEGKTVALTAALVHLLFNINGILIFYVIKPLRAIPIVLAKTFGEVCAKRRRYAIIYLVSVFGLLPLLIVLFGR